MKRAALLANLLACAFLGYAFAGGLAAHRYGDAVLNVACLVILVVLATRAFGEE